MKHVFLVRHGETEWSKSGKHTGRTNIALTQEGRDRARRIALYLADRKFDAVWSSPLLRARETCELAGFAANMEIDDDLMEWDYGVYEGRTTLEIRESGDPNWSVWLSPITGGESLEQVFGRATAVVEKISNHGGDTSVVFAHGHILRILAAAWIGLPGAAGRLLALDTATVSLLGYERKTRVIREWNVTPPPV
jgi:broad specificity phosphatase PhoE